MKPKADDSNGHIQQIDLERIHASPTNPRKTFSPDSLKDLAETIKSQGVLQPILLRPMPGWNLVPNLSSSKGFIWENLGIKMLGGHVKKEADGETTRPLEIVAGERRFRAAKLAGLEAIPAIVREMTDRQVLEIQMIENEQREDVLPSERAAAYRRLAKNGSSVEAIASQIGKSVSSVRDLLKVADRLQLPAVEALDAGKLPLSVAVLLARIPGEQAREKATAEVLKGNWESGSEPLSYRAAKAHVERNYTVELKQATFDQADKKLVPSAGSCKTCPKRVGNLAKEDPEGYAGSRADVCTDPECFRNKAAAHNAREAAKLTRDGVPVSKEPGWRMRETHVCLSEEAHDLLTLEQEEAGEKAPTWQEALAGQLDKDRVATVDHNGAISIWVPETKALAILCPEKAAEEAKEKAAVARQLEGPNEWEVTRKARALAVAAIGEMAIANFEDLDNLGSNGGPETNAAYQALQLVAWLTFLNECGEAYLEDWEPLERRVPGIRNMEVDEADKAIREWACNKAVPRELLAFLLEMAATNTVATTDKAVQPIGELILNNFTEDGMKPFEKEAKAALKAEAKAKKGKPQTTRQEMEGDDAPEETDEPAPQASQIPDLEVKDIEDVGLTREQLDAAYIGDKFGHKVLTGPITVKPVTIMGTLYVSSGSAGTATNLVWDLLPLRLARAFVIDSVYLDIPTKWQPNGDREHGWYAGVCVKVGKTEYAIGPDSEGRKVSWQGQPAESEAAV